MLTTKAPPASEDGTTRVLDITGQPLTQGPGVTVDPLRGTPARFRSPGPSVWHSVAVLSGRGTLLGMLAGWAVLAAACGPVEPEPTAKATTVPVAAETSASEPSSSTTAGGGQAEAFDQAPETLVGPRLDSFEDGLLAWGLTSSGDGAVSVVDAGTGDWYEIVHAGEAPYCGAAAALDGDAVLIGNASVDSDRAIGLVVDISAKTAEPFEVPNLLDGHCPAAVATSTGLIAWTTDSDAQLPVTLASFDSTAGAWTELPPPPFPSGTYETGGISDDAQFILIGSTEERPNFIGASLNLTDQTWSRLPDAPIATWEGPRLIWTGRDILITSSWPQLLTGGEVNPFPEPLAPGGRYDPESGSWQTTALAPVWTDGIPIWTGAQVLWWQPGWEHATVFDPESDRWWHISGPTFDSLPDDHDTLWAGTWTGTHAVASDGSGFYSWMPDLGDVIELDRSGHPRSDQPIDPGAAAGTRTGRLGLLGQACGFRGRNTITVTVTENNDFSLEYVIDREEPCGSVIVHEGAMTGSIDVDSRQFSGLGEGTVDGRAVVITCECEITADNRVRGRTDRRRCPEVHNRVRRRLTPSDNRRGAPLGRTQQSGTYSPRRITLDYGRPPRVMTGPPSWGRSSVVGEVDVARRVGRPFRIGRVPSGAASSTVTDSCGLPGHVAGTKSDSTAKAISTWSSNSSICGPRSRSPIAWPLAQPCSVTRR